MAFDYGKAGNIAHYNQVSKSTLYKYYKSKYPLHNHRFSAPYKHTSLYINKFKCLRSLIANSVNNFCLMSVNTSSVQRAGHEGAHSAVVRGTRHAGRPKGRGIAAHTDP